MQQKENQKNILYVLQTSCRCFKLKVYTGIMPFKPLKFVTLVLNREGAADMNIILVNIHWQQLVQFYYRSMSPSLTRHPVCLSSSCRGRSALRL